MEAGATAGRVLSRPSRGPRRLQIAGFSIPSGAAEPVMVVHDSKDGSALETAFADRARNHAGGDGFPSLPTAENTAGDGHGRAFSRGHSHVPEISRRCRLSL